MNKLIYKYDKKISREKVSELFATDNWTSAKYPNRLQKALENSDTVITAWDGDVLVGLASAISDGYINMFVTWLIVRPEYQNHGVGGELMKKLMVEYKGFGNLILTTDVGKLERFYNKFGFEADKNGGPMFSHDWQNDVQ
jgi:predicted N-acetyltransferase YhbS